MISGCVVKAKVVVTTYLYSTEAVVVHKINKGALKDTISLLSYNEPNDTRSAIGLSVNCESVDTCSL